MNTIRIDKIIMSFVFLLSCINSYSFEIGPISVGGCIRSNYVSGDYTKNGSDAPQRGDNGGNFELDTFRINLDYNNEAWKGKLEYRWYDGYNFLHTGWLEYSLSEINKIQIGLNRVPFGVGAYGPANSWFFDQHYYVGLSDDMDYGIKFMHFTDSLKLYAGYYFSAENSFNGASSESARYSYDIIDNGSDYGHYEERNQFNFRGIKTFNGDSTSTDLGISLQWSELKADTSFADDSDSFAVSVHSKTTMGNMVLMLQLTSYKYDADYLATATDNNGNPLNNDLISMGAYDFAWPVATEGLIPSIALSYTFKPDVDFIDSITIYNDYSVILKKGETLNGVDFNDSAMNVFGAAFASGGWYIYVDYAYSNGNYFVGNDGDNYSSYDGVGDFGVNGNDDWNGRFNINFGYYF